MRLKKINIWSHVIRALKRPLALAVALVKTREKEPLELALLSLALTLWVWVSSISVHQYCATAPRPLGNGVDVLPEKNAK